jgi:hypothetical protein
MKSAVSVILLLFVAVSVVYLIVGETRSPSATNPAPVAEGPAATPTGAPSGKAAVTAATERVPDARTIVYYFHGTMRCPTCLKMERYAREAIEETFVAERDAELVRFRAVNYDEPANEHFIREYGLTASALVVVTETHDGPDSWRNLDRIWELVGDEVGFKAYVVNEVNGMLRGES